jgi:hypothetical protein
MRRALAASMHALLREMGTAAAPPMFFEEESPREARHV